MRTPTEALGGEHPCRYWLAALMGLEPEGGLWEIRFRAKGRELRRIGFYDHVVTATLRCLALAKLGDVYVGVAPRREVYRAADGKQSGGLDAIQRVWNLFVDCDTPEAVEALHAFDGPAPSIIVGSGNGQHAYWPLIEPLSPPDARQGNRRLALSLGADMNATDAARVLRPPGTLNHKTNPPIPVEAHRLSFYPHLARAVVAHLPDPPEPTPAPTVAMRAAGDSGVLVEGACRVVREAKSGNRNAVLNWAAFSLGKRVSAGEVDEEDARQRLYEAGIAAGLPEGEALGAMEKGMRDGIRRG